MFVTDDLPVVRFTCRICEADGEHTVHPAREMMYGSRESFDYVSCSHCGCLQIHKIPDDLARHYPSDYYSQQPRSEPPAPSGLKGQVMRWYCRSSTLSPDSLPGRALRSLLPVPGDLAAVGEYLAEARLRSASDRILDVGCGASPYLLAAMRRCGFEAVEGIDPFIPADLHYEGIPVHRRTIDEVQGEFGMVMFNHSLEHVPDPVAALREAARLLRPGGTCLVRIPVMGTYFWRRFGVNWVELDAPRHLHLLTVKSVGLLAERAGFKLRKVVFDSEPWELSASIQYERGIPLRSEGKPPFSASELQAFRDQAAELNRTNDAGRARFYLTRG
jgi:SAM-dependent methyltransferase